MTYSQFHRYRHTQSLRDLFQEKTLTVNDVILPIFIHESLTQKKRNCITPRDVSMVTRRPK